jgi:NAD(P)-dependent dehydrogenase (short-subunit alcohol dehydrogenase family)
VRLKGKVIAITGAGRGIGRAAAELFAREGATVVVLELSADDGGEVVRVISEAGGRAHFIGTDVADPASVASAFAEIDRQFGRLEVLYNNASVYLSDKDGPLADVAWETWRRVLSINLDGLFHCTQRALPLLLRQGGAIINTGSSASQIGIPNCDAYTASKGATVALTRSMAVEYGPRGVRVNCIAPAAIQTPMLQGSNPADSGRFDEERFLKLRTPLRRYGRPEEIARVALFLASDEASYLNGAILVADGGITINGDLSRIPGEGGIA